MATQLEVLTAAQIKRFGAPPKFTQEERQIYFEQSDTVKRYLRTLRTVNNKVSFILQYGYFRAKGRFFDPGDFQVKDINFVHRTYGLRRTHSGEADLATLYGGAGATRHRKEILRIEGWTPFDGAARKALEAHAYWQSEKQAVPEEMLYALVSFCWAKRIVIPAYHVLSAIIGQGYQAFEDRALSKIGSQLSTLNRHELLKLLKDRLNNFSLLADIRKIEQSTSAKGMKKNVAQLKVLVPLFFHNQTLIRDLELSDQAADYFASWIQKARTAQVKQIKNPNKLCLYLLAFIKTQYYRRQDAAMKGFLACVRASLNKATKKAKTFDKDNLKAKNQAIDALSASHKKLTEFALEMIRVVDDASFSAARKVEIIRNRAINIIADQDDEFVGRVNFLDSYREKERNDLVLIDALEQESRALQSKVAGTVQLLVFDEIHSDPTLMKAITFFQEKTGAIGQSPPIQFLTKTERAVVYKEGVLRTSLYKIFLFKHIFDKVKSGKLSLKYSFEYRALQNYLLDADHWACNKAEILDTAGLMPYEDAASHLDQLKEKLESTYERVNARFSAGHNGYLFMRPNGRFHVKTPAIDFEKSKYISTLLASEGEIPLLQMLKVINQHCEFTSQLGHHAHRHTVKGIESHIAIAGIMALGCNIGPRRMASMSIGVSEPVLLDCINWRFSRKNLRKINNRIIDAIEALDLPNIFKVNDNCIHSSSDGKKVTVAVDSLLASYSFKYYGKEKGVSMYSFVNEKQSLFHPTIISSTDREAIYVVDGLLHNSTAIHHIHSTDTHGYTEAVFGATHFINVAFAPRFKRLEDQVIYSFYPKSHYAKKGYWVLPSRQINRKLIEDNWDDILRFMATIKLGHTSASQLFKRLNSYSKDHPLYQALKEFGRIMKSQHILTYYDDLEFRQHIQKQLNRVELSNKFSDAVFWDRGKQFQVGTKEQQEKYNLCKTIIQNAIIYWNYLFLSERLLNTGNAQDRNDMLNSIEKGSVLAWKHINFTGEYDFTKPAAKEYKFDMRRINKLRLDKLRGS